MADDNAIFAAINELKSQLPGQGGQQGDQGVGQASQQGQDQTPGAGQQPVTPPVAPGVPSPGQQPQPPPISPEQVSQLVYQLTGGRTTDPIELQMYLKTADGAMETILAADQAGKRQKQQEQINESLSNEILRNWEKIRKEGGTVADCLAWTVQEAAAAGAEIADRRRVTSEQDKLTAAQRSNEGRISFFNDNQDLLPHQEIVDKLVARKMHPVEAGNIVRSLIKTGGLPAAGAQPPQVAAPQVSIPGLTREQVEAALRSGSSTTPAVLDQAQNFKDSEARKKMISEIESKMSKAESPEDVWAAIRQNYKPG